MSHISDPRPKKRAEVDTVLRKEAAMDCKTPSNPLGLSKGHNIPHGKSKSTHEQ